MRIISVNPARKISHYDKHRDRNGIIQSLFASVRLLFHFFILLVGFQLKQSRRILNFRVQASSSKYSCYHYYHPPDLLSQNKTEKAGKKSSDLHSSL